MLKAYDHRLIELSMYVVAIQQHNEPTEPIKVLNY